jgi:transposase InsO family protein
MHGRIRCAVSSSRVSTLWTKAASRNSSEDFQRLLSAHGITCSMSRKGECWDTALGNGRDRRGRPREGSVKGAGKRGQGQAGASFEDRQDLLGHRSGRITTHYCAAELTSLLDAANRVCGEGPEKVPNSYC